MSSGEELIDTRPANLWRGMETVGGEITITTRRLLFQPHRSNVQRAPEQILLAEVVQVNPIDYGHIFKSKNGVMVELRSGAEYRFVVNDRDRMIDIIRTCALARAQLPYKLPPKAKYTASPESIAKAKASLSTNLVADADTLTNLFSSPMFCGPGLWDLLKSSPHFSKPPVAKTTVKIPIRKRKAQELPLALLQSEEEVASFRKALADLLSSQGTLLFREPNKDEFMTFWSVIPFDEITGPLLVAEGKEVSIFCEVEKGRVFWADEVKRMHSKK